MTRQIVLSNSPRILVFATYHLGQLIHSVVSAHAPRVVLKVVKATADELQQRMKLEADTFLPDVVLAAGRGADWIRAHAAVPVVVIEAGSLALLEAIARARQSHAKVVVVGRERLHTQFQRLAGLIPDEVAYFRYELDSDVMEMLASLECATDVAIVGSSRIVELAGAHALQGELVYSIESVMRALQSALELVRLAHLEKARRERIDRILEGLAEGVAAVDMQGRLQTVNPALARLLGTTPAWAEGRILSEMASDLAMDAVLRTGDPVRDTVVQLSGKTLLAQKIPLYEAGVQVGAVLTLQATASIERADRSLKARHRTNRFRAKYTLDQVVGESAAINQAKSLARLYGDSDASVLIIGESGTGKELFAQGIHRASARCNEPFVAVNCAAFPETLLESELFGYEEGAFTGSRRGGKPGLFEVAEGGTLFLDEIADMPVTLQSRLLRVLQEREVLRLGATDPVPIDVRIIAATHANLLDAVLEGTFRRDLYYRLAILTLHIPPLHARVEDIPQIARAMLNDIQSRLGKQWQMARLIQWLTENTAHYMWPGNVRELQNILERLSAFAAIHGDMDESQFRLLVPEIENHEAVEGVLAGKINQLRRDEAMSMVALCGGDRVAAAKRLGVSRTTLWRLLR
ncbi:sigma 54-interacting transcriptional regulator [Burkholderiaceae bacterium DAT-1]|nr:sigma 54-interacting transcriptional regulator [Burkholderiaceae bacterium DAT-1]